MQDKTNPDCLEDEKCEASAERPWPWPRGTGFAQGNALKWKGKITSLKFPATTHFLIFVCYSGKPGDPNGRCV